MKTLEIKVRDPVALWHEIKDFMRIHYQVSEVISFEKQYPEVYHIYLTLVSQKGK